MLSVVTFGTARATRRGLRQGRRERCAAGHLATAIALLCCSWARRQVGPVPAPRLAARRDGGPDPGLGADPRRDDGHGRRLPGRARPRALRAVAGARSTWSPGSAASPRSSRPPSRWCRPTSSGCSPTRPSASSATCSSASASGAYAAGIFHLVTHAFFKALLFLGAGSGHPRPAGEQDIRKMGGLAPEACRSPSCTFLVGAWRSPGVPPLRRLLLEGRDPRRRVLRTGTTAMLSALLAGRPRS